MQASHCCRRSNSSRVQAASPGHRQQSGDPEFILLVAQALLGLHGDEMGRDRAIGQLILDVALAAAEHDGLEPPMHSLEIAVADGAAALVELVEITIEAEQWPKQPRVEILDDRVDLVDAVLEGRAGQHEGVGASESLDRSRGLGLPVLDTLRLVQNHDVGLEQAVDVGGVGDDLLVVGEIEEHWALVTAQAGSPIALHDLHRQCGEARDLLLPLRLERGRRHH